MTEANGAAFVACVQTVDAVYFTPFDLPVPVDERANVSLYGQALEPFSIGTYQLDTDRYSTREGNQEVLAALRTTYRERIRDVFRAQRPSVIAQLIPMRISGLSIEADGELHELQHAVEIVPIVTIHGVGTGQVILWITVRSPISEVALIALRRAGSVRVRLDQPYFGFRYLNGWLTIEEVTHFLILFAMSAGRRKNLTTSSIDHERERAGSTRAALDAILNSLPDRRHIYSGLEVYPALAVRTSSDTKGLLEVVKTCNAFLRGVVTGDKNWARKSQAIVSRLIPNSDVSTRESIIWFMDLNGSLKLYSTDLETPYLLSVGLMIFELDVLLTQRLVLLKSSYYLSFVERAKGYSELLRVREGQLRLVNEFYSSTIAFKDTTASRLQALQNAFRLDSLEAESERLLSGLAESLRAASDARTLQRQTLLTVVFAAFGGASLADDLIVNLSAPNASAARILLWTSVGFIVSTLAGLLLATGLLNRRGRS